MSFKRGLALSCPVSLRLREKDKRWDLGSPTHPPTLKKHCCRNCNDTLWTSHKESLQNQDRSRKARLLPFYNNIPITMVVKYKFPLLTTKKRHVVNPVQMDWESKICKIEKSCVSFKCSTGFQTSIYHDFPQQPQFWALCFFFNIIFKVGLSRAFEL